MLIVLIGEGELDEEEVIEPRYCEECGTELDADTPDTVYRCEDCALVQCPMCGDEVEQDELAIPQECHHYDDAYKVCEKCQDRYQTKLERLLYNAREEADEWFEGEIRNYR